MSDFFGADGIATEGQSTSGAPTGGSMLATTPTTAGAPPVVHAATLPPVAGTAPQAPTLQQAIDKGKAKAAADQQVATDPHAVHHVKLAPLAPSVLGSTATGALIGSVIPGIGTLIGAGVGYAVERWQIGGGPFGKVAGKVKPHLMKAMGK